MRLTALQCVGIFMLYGKYQRLTVPCSVRPYYVFEKLWLFLSKIKYCFYKYVCMHSAEKHELLLEMASIFLKNKVFKTFSVHHCYM